MVAIDLLSGKRIRQWLNRDNAGDEEKKYWPERTTPDPSSVFPCPFACDNRELFVAWYGSAETSSFRALGWPKPRRMLDLFTAFRRAHNGMPVPFGNSLIGVLTTFGLPAIEFEEKQTMRELAQRGGPYTAAEIVALLDYCETDVRGLALVIEKIFEEGGLFDLKLFGQELLRGRYMIDAGYHLEWNGVSINEGEFRVVVETMPEIQESLIEAIDQDFGVYVGGSFSTELFAAYLIANNISWIRDKKSGRLKLDDETFSLKAARYPQLAPLHELRTTLSSTRLHKLAIGSDGRNRALLSAFRATTSRNQPSNAKFIFGPATWIRSFIQPPPNRAIAYLDYATQEVGIAAALSGDEALWSDYASGSVYLKFAARIGIVPGNATKETHPNEHQFCKSLFLAINYAMSEQGFASRANLHIEEARYFVRRHKTTYATYHRWVEGIVNRALLCQPLETAFGWRLWWKPGVEALREDYMAKRKCRSEASERGPKDHVMRPRTAQNFLMQANGAEMTRLSICEACDAGIMVCAPIHDAILIEGSFEEIGTDESPGSHVLHLQKIMGDVSETILGPGYRIRVDHKIVRWPDHYSDKRGEKMFETIRGELERVQFRHGKRAAE
jgi:hypothetical protein